MSKRNQKTLLLLIVAIIGMFTAARVTPTSPVNGTFATSSISSTEWYPVTKVVDGDTIDVSINNETVKVRMIGLDTPEVVDPRQPVQCFGREASDKAKQLLNGQYVRLETDPTQGIYDKFHRLLAYVWMPLNSKPEGLLVNEFMIAEGYGHEYTYNLPYKYQVQFKAAQKSARESQRGLWAPGVCTD